MPKLVLAGRQSRKGKVSLGAGKARHAAGIVTHASQPPAPTEGWECVLCRTSHPDKVGNPRPQYFGNICTEFSGLKTKPEDNVP